MNARKALARSGTPRINNSYPLAAPALRILERLVLVDAGVHLELDAHLADVGGCLRRIARHT